MKHQYTVYDSKAENYYDIITRLNKAVMLREWGELVNDEKNPISQHPEDYTLFEIGTWDETKGEATRHEAKIPLGTALEHKKTE